MDCQKLSLSSALAVALATLLFCTSATGEIYRWTDASGKIHFGDRQPVQQSSTQVIEQQQHHAAPLTVAITPHAYDLDQHMRAQAEAGIQQIFDVFRRLFRLNLRRPVLVDIHLFPDADSMAAWVHEIDPKVSIPPGLLGIYLPGPNVIGTWQHSPDNKAIVATLLHESSHVLLAQLSPNAPAWLHEGLAQYFEGMDIDNVDDIVILPATRASAAIDWFVAEKKLITLRQYFSMDEKQWRHQAYVAKNPIPYSVAWSVTHFLMSRTVGRQILIELLQDLEKAQKKPTIETIEHRYPGGYALMEFDWFKWAQSAKAPHVLAW